MDLANIDPKKKANTGAFLHLIHPGTGLPLYDSDDQSKPVGLRLMGKDSDVYARTRHKNLNSVIGAKKKSEPKTSEQIERETIELLADMTVGWDNLSYGGAEKFSREAVIALYTGMPWVREQADTFVSDRANFI